MGNISKGTEMHQAIDDIFGNGCKHTHLILTGKQSSGKTTLARWMQAISPEIVILDVTKYNIKKEMEVSTRPTIFCVSGTSLPKNFNPSNAWIYNVDKEQENNG